MKLLYLIGALGAGLGLIVRLHRYKVHSNVTHAWQVDHQRREWREGLGEDAISGKWPINKLTDWTQ